MAGDPQSTKISALDAVDPLNTDPNAPAFPGNDTTLTTKKWTPRQVTDAAGALTTSGDVVFTGKLGATVAATIQPAAVTLVKQAALPAHTAIGNPTGISATPQAFTFDPASFVFVGSQLQATAAAAASDASSMYDYERFGSGAL